MIFTGLFTSLQFTLSTGNQPWLEERLIIDGNNYIGGMNSIIAGNDFLHLENTRQSPGYQMYLALLHMIVRDQNIIFKVVKMIAWVVTVLSSGLIFYLGERYFGRYVGAVAAMLFSFSYKYHAYINLLQYEVLAGFLFLVYVYLQLALISCQKTRLRSMLLVATGTVATVICFIHFRFLYVIPFGLLYLYISGRRYPYDRQRPFRHMLSALFLFILPFLLLFVTWSVYQSSVHHEVVVGQDGLVSLFNEYNSIHSVGWAYPPPEKIEGPLGVAFIVSYPGKFLWLIKERFLYLWDLKKDIWYVGHPLIGYLDKRFNKEVFALPFYLVCFIAFFIGMLQKAAADVKRGYIEVTSCFYFTLLPALIIPLFVFSSSRYLVPVVPLIILFQAYVIRYLTFGAPER